VQRQETEEKLRA